jgi:type II secretory pathway component GspD/PulD (secretin)
MSRLPLLRAAGALTLLLGLAVLAAADPPAPAKDDAGNKRLIYIVKHGVAKDLAAVLGEHLKGVAEIQALPDATSNCLLINASPSALDEVVKVLEQLDRRPQTVSIEIVIAEIGKKAEGEKTAPAEDVDEKDFTGTIADVNSRVEALQKKGIISGVKRLQLTAVEGLSASVSVGENKPYVTGMNHVATGATVRSISYRNAGIKADASVRVSSEKVVTLDLKLEDAHPYTSEDAPAIGTDENGKPVLATEFAVTNLNTKLDIASGHAQAAEGVKTQAKSDKAHTVIIVGARMIEPDAKPEK